MTFPISDMVSMSISIAAGGLRAPEMSVPILIGYHTAYADYVREYHSLTELNADGIVPGRPLYRMAQALLAQTPAPTSFKVGRRTNAPVQVGRITPLTFAAGQTLTITLTAPNGNSRSYSQAAGGASLDAECTALALAINADPSGFGVGGGTGTTEILATAVIAGADNYVSITAGAGAAAGQIFYYSGLRNYDFWDLTPDPGLAADLLLIRAEDDDWYAASLDSPSEAEQLVFATSLAVAGKSVWLSSQDSLIRNATAGNLALDLLAAGRDRAVLCYSPHSMTEYPGAALMSKMITFNPGATTAANQILAGVTPAGTNPWDLSVAQLANLRAARANAYIVFGGGGCVDPQAGYCSATRYVDERLILDYLQGNIPVELANAVQARVSAGSKVPYTDEAAAVARAAILKILALAEKWGALILFDKESGINYFTFSATKAAAQTAGNKAARIFAGCEFGCLVTGAAQQFRLTGTLSFV